MQTYTFFSKAMPSLGKGKQSIHWNEIPNCFNQPESISSHITLHLDDT